MIDHIGSFYLNHPFIIIFMFFLLGAVFMSGVLRKIPSKLEFTKRVRELDDLSIKLEHYLRKNVHDKILFQLKRGWERDNLIMARYVLKKREFEKISRKLAIDVGKPWNVEFLKNLKNSSLKTSPPIKMYLALKRELDDLTRKLAQELEYTFKKEKFLKRLKPTRNFHLSFSLFSMKLCVWMSKKFKQRVVIYSQLFNKKAKIERNTWSRNKTVFKNNSRKTEPHEILGINRDAGTDEINFAFRVLVRKNHPDLIAGEGSSAWYRAQHKTILIIRAKTELIERRRYRRAA